MFNAFGRDSLRSEIVDPGFLGTKCQYKAHMRQGSQTRSAIEEKTPGNLFDKLAKLDTAAETGHNCP